MTKIKFFLDTGYVGAKHEEIVEFEDGQLPKDEEERREWLWKYYNDWKNEQIEGYWKEIE